jgi:O-antigen/teichoic acid export membrane protein
MAEESDAAATAGQEAQQAGRGVVYIAFAKFYFMVAGAVIEFRLPAILANTVFGAYAVVSSMISPLNNVLITGTIQSVSRFTAQKPEMARAVQRAGFRMHLYIGLPVALAFIALAPVFAWFFHDTDKTGPLMLAGLIAAGYAFYAVMVGTANGRREFHKQAALDITMATLRAVGILGLAMAGFGLYGALAGWVGAVGVILVVSSFVIGLPGRARAGEPTQPLKPLISFFVSVAVYLVLLNLLMFVDQMLLKRLVTEWFHEHTEATRMAFDQVIGWSPVSIESSDAELADGQVAYYRAVQNLARLSYQAIIAATFVIFPLVSRSTFADDKDATRRYISTTMRYSFIFATAIAVVFAANPQALLDIPYATDYAVFGAAPLAVLALGNVAFSLFAIAGTILNGAGLTRQAIIIAAVTLGAAVVANAILIPRFDPGTGVLLACAIATSGAMVFGAVLAGWQLYKHLGASLPILTVVRVGVAIGAAIAVGRVLGFTTPLMTLVGAGVVGITFLVVLVASRELTGADLGAVTSVLRRKKGGSR